MTFVRAAAAAVIVTLASVVGATAKPIATTTETNLRKGPGTDSEVLTLIPKGTTVEIGKCTNGWCEASLDGKDGFVIARNVGLAPRRAPFRPQVYPPGPPPIYSPYPYGPYPYRPYPYAYYGWYRPWGWGWGWRAW
jgi:SH3 domain-containing protein